MRYVVIKSYTLDGMTEQIEPLLADGWKLQGGVSIGYAEYQTEYDTRNGDASSTIIFAQALIKE